MHSNPISAWILAACLAAAAPLAQAANAQVNVRTSAIDTQRFDTFDVGNAGGQASSPPVVSYTTGSVVGDSSAGAYAQVDGLAGTLRTSLTAAVAAERELAGRGASATSSLSLTGSIGIVGPAAPAAATFSAVLEGTHVIDPARFQDRIELDYSFLVGASPQFNGHQAYGPGAGTFSIPFTWTQTVHSGDSLAFDLYLHASVTSTVGSAAFNALNTFKITAVDLPPGYSFRPDADGFLSQFGVAAAVPEPASALLAGLGLAMVVWVRRRPGHCGASGIFKPSPPPAR